MRQRYAENWFFTVILLLSMTSLRKTCSRSDAKGLLLNQSLKTRGWVFCFENILFSACRVCYNQLPVGVKCFVSFFVISAHKELFVKKPILNPGNNSTLFLPTAMVFARKKILFYLIAVVLLCVVAPSRSVAQCPTFTVPGPVCAGGNCGAGTPIVLGADTVGITRYEWIITGQNETDTVRGKDPVYSFANPGTYQVALRITRNGTTQTCPAQSVTVQGFDEFTIGPDNNLGPPEEEICKGTSITLEAEFQQGGPPPGATYLWSRGETTPTITTDSAGCYSVTITDPSTGCARSAKVNVRVYKPDPNQPPPPKEESRWYFGNGSGIKFVGGQPEAITGNANTPEGTSSISDAAGVFLFYTDGRNVYDKAGNPMKDRQGQDVTIANNNGLNGGSNSTQAVLIVAQPGCNDCEPVYYVFTTTDIGAGGSRLEYSVVDMRLNGGLGEVTQKNVPLFDTSTERITTIAATPDSTNPQRPETTWIVTHDFNANTFRVYPLTARGVGSPKTYSVGETHGGSTENGEGYLKVYEKKVVVVIPGAPGQENIVQVFDFDAATGVISGPPNTIRLGLSPPKAYGVEIVRDSTLYVSLTGAVPPTSTADSSKILGFDLSSGVDTTIQKSRREIFKTNTVSIGALQLDPNGQRLFVAQQGQSSLGEITNPGTLASATYNPQGVALNAPSQLGLPNSKPPNNQNTGQGFVFETPQCTLLDSTATIGFQAQPDRAGGDTLQSAYQWKFFNADNSFTRDFARGNGTLPGYGVNASVSVTFPGPGTYTAQLTIYNDCTDLNVPGGATPETFTQTVVIPVQPPQPTVRDTSSCNNTPITLDPYPGLQMPPELTYTWITSEDTIQGSRTLPVTSSGSYTVIVSNGACADTATVRVNYTSPTVNLGNDTTLCSSGALVLNAGNPGATYEWFDSANQPLGTNQTLSVTPTVSTGYRVRVTDPLTRCTAEDGIQVTVNRRPRITAVVQNATNCDPTDPSSAGSITLSTLDTEPYVYRWLDSDGSELFSSDAPGQLILRPGIYRIEVRKQNPQPQDCDTTLTVAIENESADSPQFSSNSPVTLDCDATEGSLILNRTDGTAGNRTPTTRYTLLDQNGQPPKRNGQDIPGTSGTNIPDNLTIDGLIPGVYRLEGTYGSTDCKFAFVYEITLPPSKPKIQGFAIVSGCQAAQLLVGGETANATFQWRLQGGDVVPTAPDGTANVTQAGNYIITATGTALPNCSAEDTVTVVFPEEKLVAIKPATPSCAGKEIVLEAEVTSDFDSYTWTRPDGSIFTGTQISATIAGKYLLTARNSTTGCTDTATVTPNFIPLPDAPVVTPPSPVCVGNEPPTLIASGQNFRWYADQNKRTLLSTSPGFKPSLNTRVVGSTTYYVTQSTAEGCESPATAVRVTVIPAPVVNLGPDRRVCPGSPVRLTATVASVGATYNWNNGQTTPVISVNRTGTYIVTVTAGTCTVRDTVVVTFLEAPMVNIQRREVPLCLAEGDITATLDAGPGTNYTYEWRSVDNPLTVIGNQQRLTVDNLGTYTVTVNDGGICPATDTVKVVDKCEPRVSLPDAFTPNADGENDALEVFHDYIIDFKILIFNRWGEVIFASQSPENRWDGTYKGQDVPPGTYTWKIVYKAQFYPDRPEVEFRGGVLLLR